MLTNVYVDGFNLYYGCLKGSPHKWLDLERLCCQLLASHNQIKRIRYFTARINSRPDDPQGPARQDAYLRALGYAADGDRSPRALPDHHDAHAPGAATRVWAEDGRGDQN